MKGEPRDYIKGHSERGKRKSDPSKDLPVNHSGLCLCGCGEKTPIATYTNRPLGIYEGLPTRHCQGHQSKDRKPLERYVVTDMGYATPCWKWTGPVDIVNGYGKTGGRCKVAHKAVYESIHGPVPSNLFLHHKCENKICVNPDHLEPLSRGDHLREHIRQIPEETIAAVRAAVAADSTRGANVRIAKEHGVSEAFVWRVRNKGR